MSWPKLSVKIEQEADLVTARQRARHLAELLGYDTQDQTRITTAVSEIARNALVYAGGGHVEYSFDLPQRHLVVSVSDHGEGIKALDTIMAGRYRSRNGMGLGLIGTKRLMDVFSVDTNRGAGSVVTFGKTLPKTASVTSSMLEDVGRQILDEVPDDLLTKARQHSQGLVQDLDELTLQKLKTDLLNNELEATNRGVLALHAELDRKAVDLEVLNQTLAERVERAVAARNEAEDGLRQARKMEAVGQLTGGIAHDFNNLLQIVMGNLEILDRLLPAEAAGPRRCAVNAMEGARRAAILTQRLLAFSRRQPLEPRVMEVNALVTGMVDLLRRTLGERVQIVTTLEDGLWTVEADPHQLENALLNLAVNARDAMEKGGTLTVVTTNLERAAGRPAAVEWEWVPGDYVALSVSDTGSGMSAETRARVFEPFFTTKAVGQGTGLGLSMVYGFVKQSGGHVCIDSSPGEGTTIALYLPRSTRQISHPSATRSFEGVIGGSGAIILVVEDEPGVREHSVEVLTELGYTVIAAQDGDSALKIIAERPDIDLLFTDVVLAGRISGRELAEAASIALPGIKILYTTGYSRDVIVTDGRVDAGVELLSKPFTYNELAIKIETMLS